jgi:hypothetical protein
MNIIEEIKDIKEKLNNLTRSNQPAYSEYYKINEPLESNGSIPTFNFKLKNTYSNFNLQSVLAKGDSVRWRESPTGNYKYGNIANVTSSTFSVIPNADYALNSSTIHTFEKAIVGKPVDFPDVFNYSATITPAVPSATFNVQVPNSVSTKYTVIKGNILSVFVNVIFAKINTPVPTALSITVPINHTTFGDVLYNQLGFCVNYFIECFCWVKKNSISEIIVIPYFAQFVNNNYSSIVGFIDTQTSFNTAFSFVYTYNF